MVIALLALMAAAAVVAVIVLVPVIARDKRDAELRERARLERNRAAELRRLRREQRPRRGTLAAGAPPLERLEAAITAETRARVRAGELPTPVRRTRCRRLGRKRGLVVASCTAITSDIPATAESRGGIVGYPYRAAYDPASRAYALCKTSGAAGEGSLGRSLQVELPRSAAVSGPWPPAGRPRGPGA